jgi:hypothetical protein
VQDSKYSLWKRTGKKSQPTANYPWLELISAAGRLMAFCHL